MINVIARAVVLVSVVLSSCEIVFARAGTIWV